jgi:Flp pilus assembly protein TadG
MPAATKEDGAVLVEFALVVPLLLLLVIGMMQFGILLNAKISETQLTASAARYAAVNQNPGDPDALVDYIKSRAGTNDLKNNAQVCLEYPTGETGTSGEPGDPVKVTMTYTYDLVPFLGNALTPDVASITVTGDATMRLEAIPDNNPAGCTA